MNSDHNTKLRIYELIDNSLEEQKFCKHILTGPGGTGKTTFLKELACKVLNDKHKLMIICPTHKSIRNILTEGYEHLPCKTYCSFFQCHFDILDDSENVECTIECCKDNHYTIQETLECLKESNKKIKYDLDLLIVEECSMFNHNYYQLLRRITGINFILFIGDSNQIPPINNDCKKCLECSFSIFKTTIPKSIFKEQKRHDNNVSTKLQAFIKLVSQCDNITKKKLSVILEELFELKPLDKVIPIASPVITYHVKRAEMINFLFMRGRSDIRIGDLVTVDSGSIESLPTGSIVKVINIEEDEYVCYQLKKEFKFKVYTLSNSNGEYTINTIHPEQREEYISYCRDFRFNIHKHMRFTINLLIKEHLTVFTHAYSITAHKAQGQTFITSYIDYKNILLCENIEITVKLLYSAISRAKNQIMLINVPTYFKAPTNGVIVDESLFL